MEALPETYWKYTSISDFGRVMLFIFVLITFRRLGVAVPSVMDRHHIWKGQGIFENLPVYQSAPYIMFFWYWVYYKTINYGLIGPLVGSQKSSCPLLWIAVLVIGAFPTLSHKKIFKIWKARFNVHCE